MSAIQSAVVAGPGRVLADNAYAPASQAAATAATTTFTALDTVNLQTGTFTAPPSGNVEVTVTLVAEISASAGFGFALADHGTVSPLRGVAWIFADSAATIARSFVLTFIVTGLTPGATCNFDLLGVAASLDTLTVLSLGTNSTSPAVSTRGGPTTFKVTQL